MIEKLTNKITPSVIAQFPLIVEKFAIDNPLRLAHFLSQCAHESADFKTVTENLNYGAQGLIVTFTKYFNAKSAEEYARKPEKIANRIYAGRMGNGDEASGDGYKFRGRGYIQLTGHDNYVAFDKVVDEDILSNPDLVATKYPLLSAAWFWNKVNLNPVADLGSSVDVIIKVTKKINGGTVGLDDRIINFNKYYNLLTNG
jgi:putative chitinase